jgi:hypothetical protein
MPKVSVQHLIDTATFGDALDKDYEASNDPKLKMKCLEEKFDELSDFFIQSVENNGIENVICYDPHSDRLRNGHHRVLMAWLLGISELEYTTDMDESWIIERRSHLPKSH